MASATSVRRTRWCDSKGPNRYYTVEYGFQIEVVSAKIENGSVVEVLVAAEKRPTNFSDDKVWFDTTWVGIDWLKNNFIYSGTRAGDLYSLTQYGKPGSVTGIDRLMTDDDMALETRFHLNRNDAHGLMCTIHVGGALNSVHGSSRTVTMQNALEIMTLLRNHAFSCHIADGVNFQHLLHPFVGLITVDNGEDYTHLRQFLSRTFTLMGPTQKTVFICENEDDFFMHKLAMSRPKFIHRERSTNAL